MLITRISGRLEELINEGKVPGLSIAIYKNNSWEWQAGFGYADLQYKTPVQPSQTRFRAASISKPIAACALASMVAEGLINLDASFYDYVPDFPGKKYDFSIRQLASHTAGIRGYSGKEYALNKPYTIRQSLEVFQDDPLLFEPGTQFYYNSYGFVLLSLAMEEASGIPFDVYTREKVLTPLGMTNTIPEQPATTNQQQSTSNSQPTKNNRQATCYTRRASGFREAIKVDNRFKLAGGGYLTTVQDIIRLGQAVLRKNFYPEVMSTFLESQKVNGAKTYYGLGWEVSENARGRPFYGHIGNQVGGYSYFRVFPGTGLIIAALVNCSDPKIKDILDGIAEEFQDYGV
ncbi:serine hydrolase domain-containing protein [Lentiprolixibacter aurantiacus]|uniref:Serine hydrolase n=1 Tax=Lentiprolixibacter aurantiacus TaxID=2993939 RepID=A0AAE3MK15_9FLAO|nr:serine hydrolase domain-containing protein [Lentiprolixibacter aurantiacus]MCX2719135.1 serine hydrolase [Lentiprolixibacter aurantiacus]